MHFVFIFIGVFIGVWIGSTEAEIFGGLAGALIASLIFRLDIARSKIDQLSRRVDTVERRQAIGTSARPQNLDSPQPASVSKPEPSRPTPPALELPGPKEWESAVPRPGSDSPGTDRPIVHARVVEKPPEPEPLSHTLDVAKRWLTSGNVPVKVGIVISFFGVAFLLKYAVENTAFEIPIGVRYLGVAAFATVLLVLGWRMRTTSRVYALSLQGGGIGVLFLTVFAAFQLHALLPPTLALGILVLLTVAAGVLAIRQESRALAILGTTGGFLAPLLVSTGSGNHVALFSYYLILNCAVLGVAWLRAWRELNIIGFVFTFGVGTLWGIQYYIPALFASTEPFLVLHFLFYTAIAVLFAFRQPPKLRGFVDASLVFGTPTIAFALQTQLLEDSRYGLAISAAVVAAFYAALAVWLRRTQERNFDLLAQSFAALSVAFATIAIPLAVDDRWTAMAWALEGTALVWIGVRQNGRLARLTGAVLAFAAGIAFLNYGWRYDLGIAVLNGNYLGGALISLSSIVSARLLVTDSKDVAWPEFVSICLLGWGLLWWFGTGHAEIFDRAPGDAELHLLLLFLSGSFAVMAFAAGHYRWAILKRTTLAFLPVLMFAALAYLAEHDHLFAGLGALGWIAAIAVHLRILHGFEDDQDRIESVWHAWGAVFFVAIAGHELFWQIDRDVLNVVWPFTWGLSVLAAGAFVFMFGRNRLQWPLTANFSAYFVASLILIAGFMLLLVAACVDVPGDPAPMPYIPVLNPFDVLSIMGLAVAWYANQVGREASLFGFDGQNRTPLALWGGSAFLLSTFAVVRAAHHLADIPWQRQALMSSVVVQTLLTIFWAALGLAGMILGTRRSNRNVWMLGVGLMVIVVAKLAVIDLGNTGTLARIVSFLGVGIMLLVVGYFSPVPPKTELATER